MRIRSTAEHLHVVERSRFFALAFPARSEEEVLAAVRRRKGELRKANHHCWALRVQGEGSAVVEGARDDGEVGHPGRVLLELLRRRDLEGAILVSRVFGGVKLGVGGVSRAFRAAAEGALDEALAGG